MMRTLLLLIAFFMLHSVLPAQTSSTWGVKLYWQHVPERLQTAQFRSNNFPIGPVVPAVSLLVQRKHTYIIDFQVNRLGLKRSNRPEILKQRDIAISTDITYQQLSRGNFSGWLGFGLEVFFQELESTYMATFSTGFIDEEIWGFRFNGVARAQYALSKRLAIDIKAPLFSLLASRTQVYGEDSLAPAPSTRAYSNYRFYFVPILFLGVEYRFGGEGR